MVHSLFGATPGILHNECGTLQVPFDLSKAASRAEYGPYVQTTLPDPMPCLSTKETVATFTFTIGIVTF